MIKQTFRNSCRSHEILLDAPVMGGAIRLTILSAYGCEDKYVWRETREGWKRIFFPKMAVLQIAGIHLICDEEAPHSDNYGSGKDMKSRTKEIEL